jgi:hypothetical protein
MERIERIGFELERSSGALQWTKALRTCREARDKQTGREDGTQPGPKAPRGQIWIDWISADQRRRGGRMVIVYVSNKPTHRPSKYHGLARSSRSSAAQLQPEDRNPPSNARRTHATQRPGA